MTNIAVTLLIGNRCLHSPSFLRVMLEMGDIDDAWLKDRILWAARRNGLPVGMTSFVDATRTNCPEFALSAMSDSGVPVLLTVCDASRWTLLGTRRIISCYGGTQPQSDIAEIASVRWPAGKTDAERRACDSLEIVHNNNTRVNVWIPAGIEFYAYFNILLRLASRDGIRTARNWR